MLKKENKKTDRNSTFLPYHLIGITLFIFFCSSSTFYSLPSSSSHNSVQQAKAQKITTTTEVTSLFSRAPIQQYQMQIPTLRNNFMIYKNPIYGIAIQYPSNWEKIEYSKTALTVGGSNLIVNFLAPIVNASDHWREHLMIQVLKQAQAKKLISQSQITIGDRQGFKSLYNSTMRISNLDRNTESTLHIKTMDMWITISNGDTYLLTYKAVASRYQNYLPTIQKMIDSFKIENSTVSAA
jgi:hypothetical protein